MENREKLSLTGVTDVSGFDESLIVLATALGPLMVRGEQLHIERIDLNAGQLEVRGRIREPELRGSGSGGRLLVAAFRLSVTEYPCADGLPAPGSRARRSPAVCCMTCSVRSGGGVETRLWDILFCLAAAAFSFLFAMRSEAGVLGTGELLLSLLALLLYFQLMSPMLCPIMERCARKIGVIWIFAQSIAKKVPKTAKKLFQNSQE
jgi:YabP family.